MTHLRHVLFGCVAMAALAAPLPALAGNLDKTCSGKNGDKLDSCLTKNFPTQRMIVETACATQPQDERFECRRSAYELAGIKITAKSESDKSSGGKDDKAESESEDVVAESTSGKGGSTAAEGAATSGGDAPANEGKSGGKGATAPEGGKAGAAPTGGKAGAAPAGGKSEGEAAGTKPPAGGDAPAAGGDAPPAGEKPKKDKSGGEAPANESAGEKPKKDKSGGEAPAPESTGKSGKSGGK